MFLLNWDYDLTPDIKRMKKPLSIVKVAFHCADGRFRCADGQVVSLQGAVLARVSRLLAELLTAEEHLPCSSCCAKPIAISLPEVNVESLRLLTNLLYKGKADCETVPKFKILMDLLDLFRIKYKITDEQGNAPMLSTECATSVQLLCVHIDLCDLKEISGDHPEEIRQGSASPTENNHEANASARERLGYEQMLEATPTPACTRPMPKSKKAKLLNCANQVSISHAKQANLSSAKADSPGGSFMPPLARTVASKARKHTLFSVRCDERYLDETVEGLDVSAVAARIQEGDATCFLCGVRKTDAALLRNHLVYHFKHRLVSKLGNGSDKITIPSTSESCKGCGAALGYKMGTKKLRELVGQQRRHWDGILPQEIAQALFRNCRSREDENPSDEAGGPPSKKPLLSGGAVGAAGACSSPPDSNAVMVAEAEDEAEAVPSTSSAALHAQSSDASVALKPVILTRKSKFQWTCAAATATADQLNAVAEPSHTTGEEPVARNFSLNEQTDHTLSNKATGLAGSTGSGTTVDTLAEISSASTSMRAGNFGVRCDEEFLDEKLSGLDIAAAAARIEDGSFACFLCNESKNTKLALRKHLLFHFKHRLEAKVEPSNEHLRPSQACKTCGGELKMSSRELLSLVLKERRYWADTGLPLKIAQTLFKRNLSHADKDSYQPPLKKPLLSEAAAAATVSSNLSYTVAEEVVGDEVVEAEAAPSTSRAALRFHSSNACAMQRPIISTASGNLRGTCPAATANAHQLNATAVPNRQPGEVPAARDIHSNERTNGHAGATSLIGAMEAVRALTLDIEREKNVSVDLPTSHRWYCSCGQHFDRIEQLDAHIGVCENRS